MYFSTQYIEKTQVKSFVQLVEILVKMKLMWELGKQFHHGLNAQEKGMQLAAEKLFLQVFFNSLNKIP